MAALDAEYYRLRTEWLRFRSHLIDRQTGLPTLAAVVEEVRRAVEARGSVDVVYLDFGRSGWQEGKLGWAAYDDALREFARLLLSLRESGELGAHDLVCLQTVRSDRFVVFAPGVAEGAAEGLRGAEARKQRLLAALRERGTAALPHSPRLSSGYAQVRKDPMVRTERAIHQAVADALLRSLVERQGVDQARRDELARMIAENGVRSVFDPIVRLQERTPIGLEALTRPLAPGSFESVEELFAFAESSELLIDFERVCRGTAIRSIAGRTPRGLLFLNTSARAVMDPDWLGGRVEAQLAEAGMRPADVVVEVTERLAVVRHERFQDQMRALKQRGYRVAVDDMGAGHASLQSLAAIEPDFLKFDVSLVRDIHRNRIKQSLLETLRGLAERIRARVIAEGVEQEQERQALIRLGIELGQGFLFQREEAG